jgi:hypothetical protein
MLPTSHVQPRTNKLHINSTITFRDPNNTKLASRLIKDMDSPSDTAIHAPILVKLDTIREARVGVSEYFSSRDVLLVATVLINAVMV